MFSFFGYVSSFYMYIICIFIFVRGGDLKFEVVICN